MQNMVLGNNIIRNSWMWRYSRLFILTVSSIYEIVFCVQLSVDRRSWLAHLARFRLFSFSASMDIFSHNHVGDRNMPIDYVKIKTPSQWFGVRITEFLTN